MVGLKKLLREPTTATTSTAAVDSATQNKKKRKLPAADPFFTETAISRKIKSI
jgi:hypothetical protein